MCPTCHVLTKVNPSDFSLRGYVTGYENAYYEGFVIVPATANPIAGAWDVGVSTGETITGESSGLHVRNLVTGNIDTGRQLSTGERIYSGATAAVGWVLMGASLRTAAQERAPSRKVQAGVERDWAGSQEPRSRCQREAFRWSKST